MKNARLIIAIVTTLLDEIIIVALILWGLPRLGVNIPLYGTILIALGFLLFAVATFRIGSRTLRQKPLAGLPNMEGVEGRVVRRLAPKGFIRAGGELWEARTEEGVIEVGADVIVVAQSGLKVTVQRKPAEEGG